HSDLSDAVRSQILTDLDQDITELRDLVEEIVTLAAQVDPASIESEPIETVGLGDLVVGVVERVRRRTGRDIEVDIDDSMVSVRPMAIERAISNLLDNAVKFDSTKGLIEVEVDAGTVTVRDRGPGIPESDLEAVFARFHRSPEARSQPGSGLGLSIVADAALAHGGGHFARRRDGGGAEVGFWIPLATR
ncbi:MAG: sensor histidine kinase, partial [Actinomycetota bacterium]